MQVLYVNNDGGGYADHVEINPNTTVEKFFSQKMSGRNAEDYLIRAQESLNFHDTSDGRHRGMKQFLDDKSYKPGLTGYDKSK